MTLLLFFAIFLLPFSQSSKVYKKRGGGEKEEEQQRQKKEWGDLAQDFYCTEKEKKGKAKRTRKEIGARFFHGQDSRERKTFSGERKRQKKLILVVAQQRNRVGERNHPLSRANHPVNLTLSYCFLFFALFLPFFAASPCVSNNKKFLDPPEKKVFGRKFPFSGGRWRIKLVSSSS